MKRILPLVVMVALIAISLVFFPAEQVIDPAQAVSEPNPIPSYEVISVEKGWYRIFCELDDDYLFPPEAFEIVDEEKDKPIPIKN